jgi:primosomal protein N' (replication factor Y)
MALLRAFRCNASSVLCSATPSLESYSLARSKKLKLIELPKRVTEHSLPEVEIVDLRKHRTGPTGLRWLSAPLHQAIDEALGEGNQAILFLNRRGYSPSLLCASCGEFVRCPACSVTLTEHRKRGLMCCHYCNFSREIPLQCPACKAFTLMGVGLGTEQIETLVKQHWPKARVLRLDRDTASSDRGQAVIESFRKGEADILVGTQMVSKGHDIGKVTVVGVIYADNSLSLPDFRAAERVFQLLAQVSGRAGRGARPGRVFVQTLQPELPLMRAVAAHDYEAYVKNELHTRQELGYPPYSRMVAVRVNAIDEQCAANVAGVLAERARAKAPKDVRLLGPAPAPIFRLRGRFRFRFLMIARNRQDLRVPLSAVIEEIERGIAPARASVDIDPYSML